MKLEKRVKIPGGMFGVDGAIHTRMSGDKGKSDKLTMPHGREAEMADYCLKCRKKHCPGTCAAFERELKRRKAEKKEGG